MVKSMAVILGLALVFVAAYARPDVVRDISEPERGSTGTPIIHDTHESDELETDELETDELETDELETDELEESRKSIRPARAARRVSGFDEPDVVVSDVTCVLPFATRKKLTPPQLNEFCRIFYIDGKPRNVAEVFDAVDEWAEEVGVVEEWTVFRDHLNTFNGKNFTVVYADFIAGLSKVANEFVAITEKDIDTELKLKEVYTLASQNYKEFYILQQINVVLTVPDSYKQYRRSTSRRRRDLA